MPLPALISSGAVTAIAVTAVLVVGVYLLLRNRTRCPKDRAPMKLVPGKGQHMVFRCTRCGHQRKTHIRKGAR